VGEIEEVVGDVEVDMGKAYSSMSFRWSINQLSDFNLPCFPSREKNISDHTGSREVSQSYLPQLYQKSLHLIHSENAAFVET
jgi:hypothetical protein